MSSKFTLHISVSILLHVCYICPRKKCENIQAYDSQLCYHISNTINYKIQVLRKAFFSPIATSRISMKRITMRDSGSCNLTHVEGTQLGKLA